MVSPFPVWGLARDGQVNPPPRVKPKPREGKREKASEKAKVKRQKAKVNGLAEHPIARPFTFYFCLFTFAFPFCLYLSPFTFYLLPFHFPF